MIEIHQNNTGRYLPPESLTAPPEDEPQRALPLTSAQQQIIRDAMRAKPNAFAADIAALEGMEGTSTRQIKDYIRRVKSRVVSARELAAIIRQYIDDNGLPNRYTGVLDYARYLDTCK